MIWIDDHFNESPSRLARMLAAHVDLLCNSAFPELRAIAERHGYEEDQTEGHLAQALTDMDKPRRDEVRTEHLAAVNAAGNDPVAEMSIDAVKRACEMLAVAPDDCWAFEGVEQKVKAACDSCGGDDAVLSYIVDLKDSSLPGMSEDRGLDILRILAAEGSRSTAFVLTHEETIVNEASLELRLVAKLDGSGIAPFPFCVLSKERLVDSTPTNGQMEEAFRVAIKRAGLRRSVFDALRLAGPKVDASFGEAKRRLLRIPPETLDAYVVDVGHKEGVSELHVIERALTAHIARDVRDLFGSHDKIRTCNERMRFLREIGLDAKGDGRDEDLVHFRNAETWEPETLINSAYSPLACGDVFEVDDQGSSGNAAAAKRFVLLGQPCDIQIRHTGERDSRAAVLAPIRFKELDLSRREASGDKLKECVLPCTLDGRTVVCDLREAAAANLSILDLATLRTDGLVAYDEGQEQPKGLLPGQGITFGERTAWLAQFIVERSSAVRKTTTSVANGTESPNSGIAKDGSQPADPGKAIPPAVVETEMTTVAVPGADAGTGSVSEDRARRKAEKAERKAAGKARNAPEMEKAEARAAIKELLKLQLVFMAPDDFSQVETGEFEEAREWRESGVKHRRPTRVTWRLRRVGRIRPPYASHLFDRYLGMLGRNAFDVDFAGPKGTVTNGVPIASVALA